MTVSGRLFNTLYLEVFRGAVQLAVSEPSRAFGTDPDAVYQISTVYVWGFFSCIVLFMLARTESPLHDECNIACSLNYGAALMRGISEEADKMNLVPWFLLLMNWGGTVAICIAGDMMYCISVAVFTNTTATLPGMFIIDINIVPGSENLNDTRL